MAMENFSRHQQGIIKRYYEHKDEISLQRLAELVTDLYLAEGKKRATVTLQRPASVATTGAKASASRMT